MMNPSQRDIEALSAYLDGNCSESEKTRVESRLKSDSSFEALFHDLKQSRSLLRGLNRRPLPRNFTLKPGMVGIRPPLPRIVPAMAWASVTAMFVFIFTLGTNLLGSFPMGASAPMLAAAPADNARGAGGGLESTTSPSSNETMQGTPTPDLMMMSVPQTSPQPIENQPPTVTSTKSPEKTFPYALVIWPALALILICVSLIFRWNTVRVFKQKYKS